MKLKEAREQIDNIDEKIEKLLDERLEVVKEIAAQKAILGKPIFDPEREEEKLKRVRHKDAFKAIMFESKIFQAAHKPRYGLLGMNLEHSISPMVHKLIAGYDYALFEVEPEDLDSFFENCEFEGINVTIPYKMQVIKYCDDLSQEARASRSVNVIKRQKDGKLIGYNTDAYGFKKTLESLPDAVDLDFENVAVLGRGGAAQAVHQVLGNAELLSREKMKSYKGADLLVNATPVGMYPNNGQLPLEVKASERASTQDLETLDLNCKAVIDVIYNPLRTKLVLEAIKQGIPAVGGLKMLFYQAVKSAEIFLDKKFDEREMALKYEELEKTYQNIALIGMPGCGKSTIGRRLAELSGRKFIDLDDEIYSREGQTAEEIILMRGEEAFRDIETKVLEDISKGHGLVIATGGGAVTRAANYDSLKQNSKIIYIKRDTEDLPVEERPISKEKGIEKLYEERAPLYEAWADITIEADDEEMAAKAILEI